MAPQPQKQPPFAQSGFSQDPNISPNNQAFSAAVWAIINKLGAQLATIIAPYLTVFFPAYGLTVQEAAAGITAAQINAAYAPGDVRRFKPALDGVTDDTAALNRWASVLGVHTFPVVASALITSAIGLVSDSTFDFTEGATILTNTPDISMFSASGNTNIIIRGGTFKQTVAGSAVAGGVALVNCTDCVVESCEFIGMQFAGIYAVAVTRCTFRGNHIHDTLGTGVDSMDIYVASSPTAPSSYNVIDGNFCFGTTFEVGIACWDPYSGVLPTHNIISNNRIGAHNGYGILVYMPDAGDSYNQIISNHVQDISANAGNTSSGAGIYVVGQDHL